MKNGSYNFKHQCLYYQITKKENDYVLVFPLAKKYFNIQDIFENCTIYKLDSGKDLRMFDHTEKINQGVEFATVGFFLKKEAVDEISKLLE
ncbi:hypothetical protein [Paenibacillus xerothermodurans]|uniref:Uncharacterized protein n=1 Tax=Paenibacillus xerothermodurans TaxID=1977292 RepID=A0A2W1N9U8_PAEXE|nr:hypothetical protein [Paenibacillus xerothermodurans]PZE20430.1 hypothetical protein CBW46_013430 [Paenibacillus xerothermodurans]